MKRDMLSYAHPGVIFLYFAGVIGCAMCTMHPAFVAASLAVSGLYLSYLRGGMHYLKSLRYGLPVLAVVTLANGYFNNLGLTVLFYIGYRPITWEALVYGLCSGGMLLAVFQWFSCYQQVMSSDKFLSLFSRLLPTTSMMLSMVFRYIPDTIQKAREIQTAQLALTGGEPGDRKTRFRQGIRLASVLMGWSMENSIETADAMRSKCYGVRRRSRYEHERLTLFDRISLAILALLLAGSLWLFFGWAGQFAFYPRLSWPEGMLGWRLGLYILFLAWPLILEGREWLYWRCCRL